MARNYYAILGIDPDASPDQIRSAYRRKAKELHPDHYEGSSEPFRDVQEAYEALSDPARRQRSPPSSVPRRNCATALSPAA